MRVALLSDIHSNYYAFTACYEDAIKCGAEMFIFLGDYVSDLSEPQRTMDLVYEIQSQYPAVCLRGNREGYMLDCESGRSSFTQGSKSGSLLFTYEHLRKKDLDFIRGLKISDTIVIEGVRIEIAHAAMDNDRFYFDDKDARLEDVFRQMQCKFLLTGHSHRQYIQRRAGKTIINPGSVGIPQNGTPYPQYALLDISSDDILCVFRTVPYNIKEAIHAQFTSKLMGYAKYWAVGVMYDMITGRECVGRLLKAVESAQGVYDEEIWRAEAVKLGMKFTEQEVMTFYREQEA